MEKIKIDLLENNNGQIPNVNSNPRDLTDDGFEKAKQSIKKFPEMLEIRALVAVKYKDKYVVIGGNQRLRALKSLGYIDAPTFVVEWSCEQINEFIIKDNLEYGQWNFDLLTNEWNIESLTEWGLELSIDADFDNLDKKDLSDDINIIYKLEIDCVDENNQQKLYNELQTRGISCRILTL